MAASLAQQASLDRLEVEARDALPLEALLLRPTMVALAAQVELEALAEASAHTLLPRLRSAEPQGMVAQQQRTAGPAEVLVVVSRLKETERPSTTPQQST